MADPRDLPGYANNRKIPTRRGRRSAAAQPQPEKDPAARRLRPAVAELLADRLDDALRYGRLDAAAPLAGQLEGLLFELVPEAMEPAPGDPVGRPIACELKQLLAFLAHLRGVSPATIAAALHEPPPDDDGVMPVNRLAVPRRPAEVEDLDD